MSCRIVCVRECRECLWKTLASYVTHSFNTYMKSTWAEYSYGEYSAWWILIATFTTHQARYRLQAIRYHVNDTYFCAFLKNPMCATMCKPYTPDGTRLRSSLSSQNTQISKRLPLTTLTHINTFHTFCVFKAVQVHAVHITVVVRVIAIGGPTAPVFTVHAVQNHWLHWQSRDTTHSKSWCHHQESHSTDWFCCYQKASERARYVICGCLEASNGNFGPLDSAQAPRSGAHV